MLPVASRRWPQHRLGHVPFGSPQVEGLHSMETPEGVTTNDPLPALGCASDAAPKGVHTVDALDQLDLLSAHSISAE